MMRKIFYRTRAVKTGRLLLMIFCLASVLTSSPGLSEQAEAFPGRSSNTGFFSNNTYSGNGDKLWGQGNSGFDDTGLSSPYPSNVDTIDEFVDYYDLFLQSTDDQRATTAAFTILNMMGEPPGTSRERARDLFNDWEDLVRAYHDAGKIDFSQSYTYSQNTLYDITRDDVMWYTEDDTRPSVVFRSLADNSIIYAIKRDCANPVGPMEALPSSSPYTVRSNMIAGGFNGGGGPDISGSFSANHYIAQTGSTNVVSNTDSSLRFDGTTANSNDVTVSAPWSVTDSSGRVWERRGSSRCYDTTGTCRTSGVQTTVRPRTFDVGDIVDNGGTVRVYWFYAERDESPDFSLSSDCSIIRVNNISDLNTNGSLFMTVTVGGEEIFSGETAQGNRTFNYPTSRQNTSNNIVRVTVNSFVPPGSSSAGDTTKAVVVPPCFQASCIDESINPLPPIIAGSDFSTQARFRNDGELAWNAGGRVTTRADYNSDTETRNVPNTASGSDVGISYGDFTSPPSTLDQQTIFMHLELDDSVIATCDISFDPYTEFTITPSNGGSSFDPTAENPSTFTYESFARAEYSPVVSGPDVNGPRATRTILRIRDGSSSTIQEDSSFTGGYNVNKPNFSDDVSVSDFRAGDEYCGRLNIDATTGLINRLGEVRNLGGPSVTTNPDCETIVDQPYVATFGADVIAGNGFGINCGTTQQGVISALYDNNGMRGSSTQFAAIAMTVIDKFSSARMRSSAPTPANGLSFFNDVSSSTYGGDYSATHCVNDYYGQRPDIKPESSEASLAKYVNGGPGTHIYSLSDGQALANKAGNNQINNGRRVAIYVDGDVDLGRNITFNNYVWNSIADIPSFYLIVDGDLKISNDVTQLDGVYVATGDIITCSEAAADTDEIYEQCGNPLEVNGSLIAENIKLNRHGQSSMRFDSPAQHPYQSPDNDCAEGAQRRVCAAETINFSPEIFLAPPGLPGTNQPGQARYDAVRTLPPVL